MNENERLAEKKITLLEARLNMLEANVDALFRYLEDVRSDRKGDRKEFNESLKQIRSEAGLSKFVPYHSRMQEKK